MGGKKVEGFAASFDLESYGLDPVWGVLLCGVVKPWGEEPKLFTIGTPSSNDSKIVGELVDELSKYGIIIAHNGMFHDRAFLNGRALHWNLPVLDPYGKIIDPLRVAKRNLNLSRNSLDALAAHLQCDEQKMHVPAEVWQRAALDHDAEAMEIIHERCMSDVRVLEMICQRLMALVGNVTFWGSA